MALRHGLDCNTSEENYRFLSRKNYIQRDFTTNQIICMIGLYEGEEGITINNELYDTIVERVEEYRKLFKGIRPGSMGNRQKIIEDLTRFCNKFNKTFDEILEVTQWYISRTQYCPNADNYIYYIDKDGKEKSRLEVSFDEYEPELENNFI